MDKLIVMGIDLEVQFLIEKYILGVSELLHYCSKLITYKYEKIE